MLTMVDEQPYGRVPGGHSAHHGVWAWGGATCEDSMTGHASERKILCCAIRVVDILYDDNNSITMMTAASHHADSVRLFARLA